MYNICPLCKKEYGEIKIKGPRLWASKGNKEPLTITEMCMDCYYTEGSDFDKSEIYWRFIKRYPEDWLLIKSKKGG